ncbi:SDR family oxidoreductase [Enterococcus casseliflavus]|uniref:SDR family oxidoreductase n=1 Tax=Enterococcus casseliflavus TaxID=37734 RepID=A0AAW8UMW7_ENTCA|nr:SDR family oxidoreductase [Enterococcus casseliflavus]MCD5200413.1 SDR family oxidoreductase [Enterococcus casseliflavus]MDT2965270.1 SDR family oxidoreductase [Enterococcus casseliflavus]QQU15602.1 SDR family oxidoreductase [Enterococcus casseliflavus]
MSEKINNPLTKYYDGKFEKQVQEAPAIQGKMQPVPDCGEDSYSGSDKLAGRKALVTGGDSGIGRAAAIAFAKEGADVAINYLPFEEEDAQEVKAVIEKAGRKAVLIPGDLKDETFARQLVHEAAKELGGLDTLVLNAGMQQAVKDIKELTTQQIQDTFTTNIISMYWTVQEALDYLPAGGSIITTTSIQSAEPSAHLLDYAATKGAITSFSKGLAAQLSEKGIRVNTVAPGPIWTPLQISGGQPQSAIPEFGQKELMKRAGQPVELAPVYVFLASDEASYVTGQVYSVTGGSFFA